MLPAELIYWPFLMCHEHLAGALVKQLQIAHTSSRSDGIFHHPPETFDGIEVVATVGRQEMEAKLAVVVVECRLERVRPMDPAPVHDHHDLFLGFPEGRHQVMGRVRTCP